MSTPAPPKQHQSNVLDVVFIGDSSRKLPVASAASYLSLQSSVTSSFHNNHLSVEEAWNAFEMVLSLIKPLNMELSMGANHYATQTQAMSLMLLLYNLLTVHPLVTPSYLIRAAAAIKPLTQWPNPHGDVALVLMTALAMELKAPGCSMWKRSLTDVPVLSQRGQHISDVCLQTIAHALAREAEGAEGTEEVPSSEAATLGSCMEPEELQLAQSVKRWELISSCAFVYVAPKTTNANAWRFVAQWESEQQKVAEKYSGSSSGSGSGSGSGSSSHKGAGGGGGGTGLSGRDRLSISERHRADSEQERLNELRRHLMSSTLLWELDGVEEEVLERELRGCGTIVLRRWFATTRQVLAQASRMSTFSEAYKYRIEHLSNILHEIVPGCSPIERGEEGEEEEEKEEKGGDDARKQRGERTTKTKTKSKKTRRRRPFMQRHKGVELQFRPIDATTEIEFLEQLDQQLFLNVNTSSTLQYHPLVMSSNCVGSRNYLNYDTDFGDLNEIALGARLPNADDLDDNGFNVTPTSEKISKLRGEASEWLDNKRKSISAWSDSGGGGGQGDTRRSASNRRFGQVMSDDKKTRVARDIEDQRRAYWEHASSMLKRFQFDGRIFYFFFFGCLLFS